MSTGRTWLVAAALALQLWAAMSSLPLRAGDGRSFVAEAAAVSAVLAVFGLQSVPLRWVIRVGVLTSGLLLARFGELGVFGGVGGSWRVLVWTAASATALVLAPSSRAVPGRTPVRAVRAHDVPDPAGPGTTPSRRSTFAGVTLGAAAVCLVGATTLLVGPRAAQMFPIGAAAGDVFDLRDNRADNALVANEQLDMTTRPRLSDEIVMTVRSPLASFWRTETYDRWDGVTWSRSDGPGGTLLIDGEVRHGADDLAAVAGETSRQEFRIETGFATAVPSAPTPVSVESSMDIGQRGDATLVSPLRPMSRGSTYTVQSRQVPTSPEALRAATGVVPSSIRERYARTPFASERTAELARSITDGLDNDYDRVRALENWMDDNTEYSLDAPLSPSGVDVVDHFLFESRLGWCEQIASSLVVMARLAGVPARLTTGFVPGEWDPVGGRFVVRERDAHAWAEVWFPEVGWVTFDPTAAVPLAGTDEATPGATAIDWREVTGAALLVVAVGLLASSVVGRSVRGALRARSLRRRRREELRTSWAAQEERRIEEQGRLVGRPRGPAETISSYAGVVGGLAGDEQLAEAGVAVDRHRFDRPERVGADRPSGPD